MLQNDFISQVSKLLPADILDKSGRVLYSTIETLQRGDVYILGLNPGGVDGPTVRDDICAKKENAYLDEEWGNGKKHSKGQHPLQLRLKWLVKELGYDLRKICASNLIFVRSRSASGSGYPEYADKCWAVHELILNHVQPEMVLVFGNSKTSPFAYLLRRHEKYHGKLPKVEMIRSGHGSGPREWMCKAFKTQLLGRNTTVVGIPHLSRYYIIGKSEVVDWIRSYTQKKL